MSAVVHSPASLDVSLVSGLFDVCDLVAIYADQNNLCFTFVHGSEARLLTVTASSSKRSKRTPGSNPGSNPQGESKKKAKNDRMASSSPADVPVDPPDSLLRALAQIRTALSETASRVLHL